jgi:hypothetical protein
MQRFSAASRTISLIDTSNTSSDWSDINDHLGDHFCVDSAASAACHKTFTESLILAQDERWRRA